MKDLSCTKLFVYSLICWISLFLPSQSFGTNDPCLSDTSFHIVVIGSSTAAGVGASPSDSAWVNRYRQYVQSLNPLNQVTNLAVGGYTTYHLMPSHFVAPSNKPSPDTLRNITEAIARSPDAIIINLPSNDVSRGYTVAEQLANFDSIAFAAQQAGIPLWICTTQPKNYNNNPVPILKQQQVRDSLWASFAPFVIDFWTGLADSTGQIDSLFDSGDGTHLNNRGHYLLMQRVVKARLLSYLYAAPPYVDYALQVSGMPGSLTCLDSTWALDLGVFNQGSFDSTGAELEILLQDGQGQVVVHIQDRVDPLAAPCTIEAFPYAFPLPEAGYYYWQASVSGIGDPQADNDTVRGSFFYPGFPTVAGIGDTLCEEGSATLMALAAPEDSLRWFRAAGSSTLLGSELVFETPPLDSITTYFVEALRGPFFMYDSLNTTERSNINFNGLMFDLVADTTLYVDSLAFKSADSSMQRVECYTKRGSYRGYENSPASWQLQADVSVQVSSIGQSVRFPTGGFQVRKGDTVGVYIQLQNPGSRLSYQGVSSPIVRSDGALTIITGSGIAHNFGASYYPRDWNGGVYYHYGFRPEGTCQSGRVPVPVYVSKPRIHLGQDTILDVTDSLYLTVGTAYADYLWSDGLTDSSRWLYGDSLGRGIFPLGLSVLDSVGCPAEDRIIVVFAPLVGNELRPSPEVQLWPNPTHGLLHLKIPEGAWNVSICDMMGRCLWNRPKVRGGKESVDIDLKYMPSGPYTLCLYQQGLAAYSRVLWIED